MNRCFLSMLSIWMALPLAQAQTCTYDRALPSAVHAVVVWPDAATSLTLPSARRPRVFLSTDTGTTVGALVLITSTTQAVAFDGLPLTASLFKVNWRLRSLVAVTTGTMATVPTRDALDLESDVRGIAPSAAEYEALLTAIGGNPAALRLQRFQIWKRSQLLMAQRLARAAAQATEAASIP